MQALIFDCDGVLVDTERDGHRVAFNQSFAEARLDCNWSVERYGHLLTTAGGKERMRRHFDETQWPVAQDQRDSLILELHRQKTEIFMALLETGALALRPGVARMVDAALAAELPVAVCSTSQERAVNAVVLKMLGQSRREKITIFAGDVVSRKKPDPEIYQLAATQLSLEPARCMVIEDSHIGLTAAKAAGMRCIITKSAYTEDEDFSAADHIVSDLDQNVDLELCRALIAQPA